MIRRTIEISRQPAHLSIRHDQLVIRGRVKPDPARKEKGPVLGCIPCEDLGVVLVDESSTTYSHAVLVRMAEHRAALVVCGRDHLPVGMYLPLAENTELLARLDSQLAASKPTRKRLWSEVVAAKVLAQADVLSEDRRSPRVRAVLRSLARRVRSGDPENVEAQAAVLYWPKVFEGAAAVTQPFRRRPGDRGALPPNNLLDYGYAALRASVARALVGAGLLPALGIKHHGRSNPFCLADDLMEPLRPLIDRRVRILASRGDLALDQPTKAELLRVLDEEVTCAGTRGPLGVAMTRYVTSFVRALNEGPAHLTIPQALPLPSAPVAPEAGAAESGGD